MTIACAVALVLLIDTSGSVNVARNQLQHAGIARALRSPEVSRLFTPDHPVAISIVRFSAWTGVLFEWRVLRSRGDVEALAGEIEALPIESGEGGTGVMVGLDAAIRRFEVVPCEADRMVIDISGDGDDNIGDDPTASRDRAVSLGIEINALPILTMEEESRRRARGLETLDQWFRENVVTPGNWVVVAHDFADVERALRLKMSMEIAGKTPWSDQAFLLQGASE